MRRIIDSDKCHELLAKSITPKYAFSENADSDEWRAALMKKFKEISGLDEIEKNTCPLDILIEENEEKDGYTQIRFSFQSERGVYVPCYFLIPDTGKKKYPVAITLQGHTTGFHISIGEKKYLPRDENSLPRNACALQAVENGFAALAIEQRGMGESKPLKSNRLWGGSCEFTAHNAVMLGRTVLGERVFDVSRAIDCLKEFEAADTDNIIITGCSGGGTTSFYAACYDERISLSAPSCAFCSYRTSVMDIYHCVCNYMPSAYKNFEMQDLAALIAPRKLLVITGEKDEIFPLHGVKDAFETVKKIYAATNAENNCKLVVTDKGHYWCEDIVWKSILDMLR